MAAYLFYQFITLTCIFGVIPIAISAKDWRHFSMDKLYSLSLEHLISNYANSPELSTNHNNTLPFLPWGSLVIFINRMYMSSQLKFYIWLISIRDLLSRGKKKVYYVYFKHTTLTATPLFRSYVNCPYFYLKFTPAGRTITR